jgi:nitrogen-specific signal transduction histidine kinase
MKYIKPPKQTEDIMTHELFLQSENSKTDLIQSQKSILDNAKVMLFLMNVDGIITFFNPEAERITGYAAKEVEQIEDPSLFLCTEAMRFTKRDIVSMKKNGLSNTNCSESIKKLILSRCFNDIECVIYNKSGSTLPVSISINPIYDDEANVSGFLGVANDISHRKNAEFNLLEALKKEKKLNELKSRFVSIASHEFRTPLSTILSSAFLAEKYTESEEQPKRKKHLQRIVQSVNTLTNILNEFLNVGKIDEGKLTTNIRQFSLPLLIEDNLRELEPILKPSQQLDYRHEGMEEIWLDSFMLRIIITNLVSNAIKFSPEKSVICILSSVDHEKITITVKDHGIGISKEDQEHLMERFFRGTNAVNIQGTGLGLHIVSKYVERLNGKIKFTSTLNRGTTFQIIFYQKKHSDEENSVDRRQ